MKVSVVMPVYNEEGTVIEIVRRVLAVDAVGQLVIVDDGSKDGTRRCLERIEDPRVTVLYHDANKGKGAALRTGLGRVSCGIVVIQDADLEYSPEEYDVLIKPIIEGKADVVYGSRFLAGPHRVHLFWHYLGNRLLTLLSNMLSNLNLTDMETCYKAFKREVLEGMNLRADRFGFEPEFTMKVARRRYKVYEVPISYHGRDYEQGKKITWKDGLAALWCIVKYRLVD